ncbi:MAG: hypothetical protein AABW65_01360 [Nanoarchaeota archaeon]
MVWRDPIDKKQGVAPLNYSILNNTYKIDPAKTPYERKKDLHDWLENLAKMWGSKNEWWISGAIALSMITNTYPRTNTNTDIALIRKKDLLEHMVKQAEEYNLFLFRRLRSYKISKNDPIKYEVYRPISIEDAINDYWKNRNLQFCSVDNYGNIIPENSIDTRIKLYLHHTNKHNKLISSEKNLNIGEINPRYLPNQTIYETNDNKKILIVNINYIRHIKEKMLSNWRWSKNPKHQQDMERILLFLNEHPAYSSPLPENLAEKLAT